MLTELNPVKEMKQYEGRDVLMTALVGSRNYNLDDSLSDLDYKVYVLPTKEDLYFGTRFQESVVGEVDFVVQDVRDLEKVLNGANLNNLQVLFSKDLQTDEAELLELVRMREEIARMTLPYLFSTNFGSVKTILKSFEKGTESTRMLVEKYGYSTKSFMSAVRLMDFLNRYHANGFSSFEEALTYSDSERRFMLGMKHGSHTKTDALTYLKELEVRTKALESVYKGQTINKETQKSVHNFLMALLNKHLKNGL